MSELLRIIDDYKDRHGQPSDASIARAIDVAPQTISSWRKRGIREAPGVDALKKLAELTKLPYEEYVLQAALVDSGYRDLMPHLDEAKRRTVPYERVLDAVLRDRGYREDPPKGPEPDIEREDSA